MSYVFNIRRHGEASQEEYESVLQALEYNKVFSVEVDGDCAWFTEECDSYFNLRLTKEQVLALAEELKDLADKL